MLQWYPALFFNRGGSSCCLNSTKIKCIWPPDDSLGRCCLMTTFQSGDVGADRYDTVVALESVKRLKPPGMPGPLLQLALNYKALSANQLLPQ